LVKKRQLLRRMEGIEKGEDILIIAGFKKKSRARKIH